MARRSVNLFWFCLLALCGVLLIGQDCAAQTDPCDPDPCVSIPNAVAGTCTEIGGPCTGPSDYFCSCDPQYTWQGGTHTCQGLPPSVILLPDTGITECFDNTQVIECPGPGQPFYGQDGQFVTNAMSYTVSPDGVTVTDNVTGFIWQREDDNTIRNRAEAITYCEDLVLPPGGYTDWRLPDVYELQSIVHYDRFGPAIDTTVFPGTDSSWYLSSDDDVANSLYKWALIFSSGRVHMTSGTGYVRCVQGESVAQSFTDNLDGTVTDNETGLMWQQEDDNQTRNWQSALEYCEGLSLGGHSDWRLPDVKELRSIVDYTRSNPAIDTAVFPGMDYFYYYWSSSTYASATYDAWVVTFGAGGVRNFSKNNSVYYVRCVR